MKKTNCRLRLKLNFFQVVDIRGNLARRIELAHLQASLDSIRELQANVKILCAIYVFFFLIFF